MIELLDENIAHPLVVTLKFVPSVGGLVEAPIVALIDAVAKAFPNGVLEVSSASLSYDLDEITIHHGIESRVQFS